MLATLLILFPFMGAGVLALFPAALLLLRRMPPHEYQQAVRAPLWFLVAVGGGIVVLGGTALARLGPGGDLVYLFNTPRGSWLLVDAYVLWGAVLLGAVLAVAAWIPAAYRCRPRQTTLACIVTLVLTGLALAMLSALHLGILLIGWIGLLGGVLVLWVALLRPRWRWQDLEVGLVLVLSGVLAACGLFLLRGAAGDDMLTGLWSPLLSASPRVTNGSAILLLMGFLGPALYLPWWCWTRRDASSLVWRPAALLIMTAGVLAVVRLLLIAFPVGSTELLPFVEPLFLIRQAINWLLAWGVLAVLAGTGWLLYGITRRHVVDGALRPLALVTTGCLLIGMAAGLLATDVSVPALVWLVMTWAGAVSIWLAVDALLPAFTRREPAERAGVLVAWLIALAALLAVPPATGYRAGVLLWTSLQPAGLLPRALLVLLGLGGLASLALLRRWARGLVADVKPAGVEWGILAPCILALALLTLGILATPLAPILTLIRGCFLP